MKALVVESATVIALGVECGGNAHDVKGGPMDNPFRGQRRQVDPTHLISSKNYSKRIKRKTCAFETLILLSIVQLNPPHVAAEKEIALIFAMKPIIFEKLPLFDENHRLTNLLERPSLN